MYVEWRMEGRGGAGRGERATEKAGESKRKKINEIFGIIKKRDRINDITVMLESTYKRNRIR